MSWAPGAALLAWARRWPGAYDGGRLTPEAREERRAWRAFFDEVAAARPTAAYNGLPAEVRAAFIYSKISLDINDRLRATKASMTEGGLARARKALRDARADEAREKGELHRWLAERTLDEEHSAMMAAADS